MKKFLSVILALAMVACVVAGFAGCSKSGKDENAASSTSQSDSTVKQSQTLIKLRMQISLLSVLQIMNLLITKIKTVNGLVLMLTFQEQLLKKWVLMLNL